MMKYARLGVVLGTLIFLSSCTWTQPPSIKEAIHAPFIVEEPLFNQPQGRLFLTEQGVWAYLPDNHDSLKALDALPGRLIRFLPLEGNHGNAHTFAVLTHHSWGLYLQRLDASPLSGSVKGSMEPLTSATKDRVTSQTDSPICMGSEALSSKHDCFTKASVGTRWHVYPMDSIATMRVHLSRPGDTEHLLAPVQRLGIVSRGVQDHVVLMQSPAAQSHGAWIAIPQSEKIAHPPHLRFGIQASCKFEDEPPHWLPSAELLTIELADDVTHPLLIEGLAYKHGVDALLWCFETGWRIALPALYRPMMWVPELELIGAPILGRSPIELSSRFSWTSALMAMLTAGFTATGDYSVADFWLESLLQSHSDTQPSAQLETLALHAMQVTAMAGRPDSAMHAGWFSTRHIWSRLNNATYQAGMVAVYAQLGDRVQWTKSNSELPKLAKRLRDHDLVAWLLWNHFRLNLAQNKEIHPLIVSHAIDELAENGQELWSLAIQSLGFFNSDDGSSSTQARSDLLASAYEAHGLSELWRFHTGDFETKRCSTSTHAQCLPDVFGRNLADFLTQTSENTERIHRLHSTARVDDRPGFESLISTRWFDEDSSDIYEKLSLLPFWSPGDLDRALSHLASDIAVHMQPFILNDQCKDIARKLAQFGEHSILKMMPIHGTDIAQLNWLTKTAPDAMCENFETLDASAQQWRQRHPKYAHLALPFYEHLLDITSPDSERVHQLKTTAQFATELVESALCQKAHLILTAIMLENRAFEDAQDHLRLANNCRKRARSLQNTAQTLSAFAHFEQTGQLPDSLPEDIRMILDRMLHRHQAHDAHSCIGLNALDYQLLDYLDEDIARLANNVRVEGPARDEFLSVRISSDVLEHAKTNYSQARAHAAQGQWMKAANQLSLARQHFRTLNHRVGIARIEYLDEVLFNGELSSIVPNHDDDLTPVKRHEHAVNKWSRLPADWAAQQLARVSLDERTQPKDFQDSEIRSMFAASLILESEEGVRERWEKFGNSVVFSTLCNPPNRVDSETTP